MFFGLSRTLAKFGGCRFGVGFRITKDNMLWMCLLVMFVELIKATWYMMVVIFWLIYAMFYGMYWVSKKIFRLIKNRI